MRVGGVEVELSWQAQGVVRLRRLAEVNFVVPQGLACQVWDCETAWPPCGGAYVSQCLEGGGRERERESEHQRVRFGGWLFLLHRPCARAPPRRGGLVPGRGTASQHAAAISYRVKGESNPRPNPRFLSMFQLLHLSPICPSHCLQSLVGALAA